MKKTRFLFALLMAVVMMAMSPTRAWAEDECEHNDIVFEESSTPGRHNKICTDCNQVIEESDCNFNEGVCEDCNYECEHSWFSDEFSHRCDICHLDNSHDWSEGVCSVCSYECDHVGRWGDDGVCLHCGYECPGHQYENFDEFEHQCTICMHPEEHDWTDGKCSYCGYECDHVFGPEGFCDNCGKECEHEWYYDKGTHECDVCHIISSHHSDGNGKCIDCGYECDHVGGWNDNGVCNYCGYECPGHQYVWLDELMHRCRICTHPEFHEPNCTRCVPLCEHSEWVNGICTQCGAFEKPVLADDGYYQIANAGNLLWYLDNVRINDDTEESFVKLTNDIVINNLTFDADGKLEQDKEDLINGHWVIYKCTFDGQGHTISGAFNDDIFTGLFNDVISSTIKNLGLTNSYFHGYEGVGAIAGQANESVIENCWSDAIMIIDEGECHGIVSQSDDDTVVRNCFYAGTSTIEGIGGNAINCYYLSDEDTSDGSKTAAQFASGEVAWLLNEGKTDGTQAWYQKLGTDAAPLLAAAEGNTVYYGVEDCLSEFGYSNSELYATKAAAHIFGNDKKLGSDGYYHPVCTRDECDVLSDVKYAKMFGKFREVTGDEAPTETIKLTKVGSYYYTSLYTDFPYILNWDVLAYIVESAEDGVVTISSNSLKKVPGNTGVILVGFAENENYTIEYNTDGFGEPAPADNLLTGLDEAFEPNANQYAFGLSNTGYIGFWRWEGIEIPAWKAYLDLSSNPSGARGFRIVFDDETTGIHQLPADASAIEGCYDLMGRKVREVKGLGIVNGKKVIVNY